MSTCLTGSPFSQLSCSQKGLRPSTAAFGVAGRPPVRVARQQLVCQARKETHLHKGLGNHLTATLAAAVLSFGSLSGAAIASEFDVINTSTPSLNYLIDDAGVLNKTTKKAVNDRLYKLEVSFEQHGTIPVQSNFKKRLLLQTETGYRLEVVTVRKLEFETDSFAFGDKILARWYPEKTDADKKGIMIVVTTGKDGAITGGPAFMQKVGDSMVDSVIGDNIPILTEQEKFNETVTSSVKRLEASLTGQKDPGAPQRAAEGKSRTYKTKAETDKSRNVFSTIVLVLLGISVIVPMLQYWGYTSKE